jgi:hypothetical protein
VFQSCRGDETVRHSEPSSLQLTASGQHTPAFGNGLANRQDAAVKLRPQRLIEPL